MSISGYKGYDLIENQKYKLTIQNTNNVLKYYSEDALGNKLTTQSFEFLAKKQHQYGCTTLKIKILLFGNGIVTDCNVIWTSPFYGSNQNTSIKVD